MKHNEKEMRESKVPWLKTQKELNAYIKSLVEGKHDYGTCVYAMSMAATAAFYYVSGKLGVTGFQASCADMDILRRTRGMELFKIIDIANLLYPQYCNDEHYPSWKSLIQTHKKWLSERAKKLLKESSDAHPAVIEHWEKLSKLT